MIKFEVGKIYSCRRTLGDDEMFQVIKRTDKNLWVVFVTKDGRKYATDEKYRKIKISEWLPEDEQFEYVHFDIGLPGITFWATDEVENYEEIVEKTLQKRKQREEAAQLKIQEELNEAKKFLQENNMSLELFDKVVEVYHTMSGTAYNLLHGVEE